MERETLLDERHEDRALVRRMSNGDRAAFDLFVHRYTPVLVRYAQAHLSSHPEAVADIVQSTLLAAIEGLERFRGDGALGAWLVSICRFQIGTFRRRRRIRDTYAGEVPEDFDRVPSTLDPPSAELEQRELEATVHGVLELLPPPYGDVLEWKYLEDLPVKAIAERLEVTPKAAESLLTRARGAFRKSFRLFSDSGTH